jgi:hypothetical protein
MPIWLWNVKTLLDSRLKDGGDAVSLHVPAAHCPPPPDRLAVVISVIGCVKPRISVQRERAWIKGGKFLKMVKFYTNF